MAWLDPFLLGPLGSMRELPSPPASGTVAVTPERTGGTRQSLMGATTLDVWSIHRLYEFEWPERLGPEVRALLRRWHGLDRRPLRLLDPMHGPNLASLDVAAVGAASRTLDAFTVVGGTAVFVPFEDPPAELDGVVGGARWTVPADTAAALRGDTTRRVPLLDRAVCVSAWARGTGQAQATVTGYDRAGATIDGEFQGGPLVELSGAWQRLTATLPAAADAESITPGLYAPAGAARTVETVGWQVEHATAPSEWSDGGACPRVLLDKFSFGYLRMNRRKITLTLRET